MDKDKLLELIRCRKSTREIAKELSCSQTNVRYWLRKHKITNYEKGVAYCHVCSSELSVTKRKFCSNRCKTIYSSKNSNSYKSQTERAKGRKQLLVDLRGGGCERCGYSRCLAALDFHHSKGVKNFSMDARAISNTSMDRLLKEFELCEVLCSNCHREEHYK